MGYVDRNLITSEYIVTKGKIHWVVFLKGIMFFVLGIILCVNHLSDFGLIVITLSVFIIIKDIVWCLCTELVLTNKRVIAKFGFIRRSSVEIIFEKVESINVHQSVVGRILDFGTIYIHGTGQAQVPIPLIIDPLKFRYAVIAEVEKK